MAQSRGSDSYYELSLLATPPLRESRVDLFAATGRPVEGFFDFGAGDKKKQPARDGRGGSKAAGSAGAADTPVVDEIPTPWTDGWTSRLTPAQHAKYLDLHAQELMGEPVHHDAEYRELHKAVAAEQSKYRKAFQDWARTHEQQSSFYSESLRAFLQQVPASSTVLELPWSSKFRVAEHINASLLPNVVQETQRTANVEYRVHVQACFGNVQVVPEEAFNDLVDTPLEALLDQQARSQRPPYVPLLSDPCALALAKHPNVAFVATFEGLLSLLLCARADDQASAALSVQVQADDRGGKCVFLESRSEPPVQAAADAIRVALEAGCRAQLSQQASTTFPAAIATHSAIHTAADDRNQAAVAQSQLQKAVHSTAPTDDAYLYEISEIGNLRGVVRVRADLFVGDVQADALTTLAQCLFRRPSSDQEEPWDDASTTAVKPVILRPQPDRLSAYGGEQITQDQCFAAWLASVICPQAAVCSPRLCTTSNRIVRVEWMTAAAGGAVQVGQLGEVLEACLLQLLSNVVSLPQGDYLYHRPNGSSMVDVLRRTEDGSELRQLLPQPAVAQGFPLIPPKWVPKAGQAPYTFPFASAQAKQSKKRKKLL